MDEVIPQILFDLGPRMSCDPSCRLTSVLRLTPDPQCTAEHR